MSHEDVRFQIIDKIRDILLKISEELAKRITSKDFLFIIKNETAKAHGRPDIEIYGGKAIIEIKRKIAEFEQAEEQIKKYIADYPLAEYAIISNYASWKIFKIKNGVLELLFSGEKPDSLLESIFREITAKKIPLSTINVLNLFKPCKLLSKDILYIFDKYNIAEDAMFKSYANIIQKIYPIGSEELKELFITHTILQMIILACLTVCFRKNAIPIDACAGQTILIDVALPFLNWWYKLYFSMDDDDKKVIESVVQNIFSKAIIVDWESGENKEDLFRELYEKFIDERERRMVGEYYTPLWLVEYVLSKAGRLKGKVVLDPFCGSGTFLVMAFHKKIEEGEKPIDAIKSVVGFDANPIAVLIARAELVFAYEQYTKQEVSPLVFHADSAGVLKYKDIPLSHDESWLVSCIPELEELEIRIKDCIAFREYGKEIDKIIGLESAFRDILRRAAKEEKKEEIAKVLESEFRELEKISSSEAARIINVIRSEVDTLASLIAKYGDSVWAVSLSSIFVPYFIRDIADIIVTNPPWILLTAVKGDYGNFLRKIARKIINKYKSDATILNASDVSQVFLYAALNTAKEKVLFVMPSSAMYVHGSKYNLAKVFGSYILKDREGEIIQIDFDAFQHGVIPCIVVASENKGQVTCKKITVSFKRQYSKSLHLSDVDIKVVNEENYEQYSKEIEEYLNYSSKEIAEILKVEKVVPMGYYIRGLFGGERKKGAPKYAGLTFSIKKYDETAQQYFIQLSGTNNPIKISAHYLKYAKLIYLSNVLPFYKRELFYILLPENQDIKSYLELIRDLASKEDYEKIDLLIKEVIFPNTYSLLSSNYFYVFSRCEGYPVAFVYKPQSEKVIIESHVSYLVSKEKEKAFYYSAALNYISKNMAVQRHVSKRAYIEIIKRGLEWRGEEWQIEVAKLSEALHNKAEEIYSGIKTRQVSPYLNAIERTEEFAKIKALLSAHER